MKFQFNSNVLKIFFTITAIIFPFMLVAIFDQSIQAEKLQTLQHDGKVLLNGLTGSLLGAADLESQGLTLQAQLLMQEYLDYTFNKHSNADPSIKTIQRVAIYFWNSTHLPRARQVLGQWTSSSFVKDSCVERKTEYFPTSDITYLIELDINHCLDVHLSFSEYHAISLPIIFSFFIMFVFGIFIHIMFHSINYASRLLVSSSDPAELIDKIDHIRWLDVSTLARKALQVRGRNLQYYQTLVLDSQHDISKVLDLLDRKFSSKEDKEFHYSLSVIRGITQRLATEVRSTDSPSDDVTAKRELSKEEFIKMIHMYFSFANIKTSLSNDFVLKINDISIFERILVNFASNSVQHGKLNPTLNLSIVKNNLKFELKTKVGFLDLFFMKFAQFTNRINLDNPEIPVYQKIFSRTGRGMNFIKKGIIKLDGKLIFSVLNEYVVTGFLIPIHFVQKDKIENPLFLAEKKRFILFRNKEFIERAIHQKLERFFIDENQLKNLIETDETFELIVDFNPEFDIPSRIMLRILTKKERIDGISLNWNKSLKSNEDF